MFTCAEYTITAFRFLKNITRIKMQSELDLLAIFVCQDFFQFFTGLMTFGNSVIPRHREITIDINTVTGLDNLRIVYVNPLRLSVIIQQLCQLFKKLVIGSIKQSGNGVSQD